MSASKYGTLIVPGGKRKLQADERGSNLWSKGPDKRHGKPWSELKEDNGWCNWIRSLKTPFGEPYHFRDYMNGHPKRVYESPIPVSCFASDTFEMGMDFLRDNWRKCVTILMDPFYFINNNTGWVTTDGSPLDDASKHRIVAFIQQAFPPFPIVEEDLDLWSRYRLGFSYCKDDTFGQARRSPGFIESFLDQAEWAIDETDIELLFHFVAAHDEYPEEWNYNKKGKLRVRVGEDDMVLKFEAHPLVMKLKDRLVKYGEANDEYNHCKLEYASELCDKADELVKEGDVDAALKLRLLIRELRVQDVVVKKRVRELRLQCAALKRASLNRRDTQADSQVEASDNTPLKKKRKKQKHKKRKELKPKKRKKATLK